MQPNRFTIEEVIIRYRPTLVLFGGMTLVMKSSRIALSKLLHYQNLQGCPSMDHTHHRGPQKKLCPLGRIVPQYALLIIKGDKEMKSFILRQSDKSSEGLDEK